MSAEQRRDLGTFLRRRRESTAPTAIGLPGGGRRRTPGLRREEVAVLAGISPTWYSQLEQGRDIRPSADVLHRIAGVLALDADERLYLLRLAQPDAATPPSALAPLRHTLLRGVDALADPGLPMYAADHYTTMIAWNAAAATWYTDFAALPDGRRTLLWWLFTDPIARERIVDWDGEAADLVARLRAAHVSRPQDPVLAEQVGRLSATSREFATLWNAQNVRERSTRIRRLRHPDLGDLEVELLVLRPADDGRAAIVLHLPLEPGSDRTSAL